VTAVGPDRVGIVSDLTSKIVGIGGNVEDSRMARLAGSFSALVLVSVPTEKLSTLRSAFSGLSDLSISVHTAPSRAGSISPVRRRFRNLFMSGADNPGLLHAVTSYLAEAKINVERLETSTEEAPFGGTTLFKMDAVVGIPPHISDTQIRNDLSSLEQKLGVDLALERVLVNDPLS